ncbi:hypothetical protein LshimejAT787_2500550 [Lyophyllum shimeji]|uniref:Uncharacterized protein n=1 Tax=Lyophyllum shimeji TaxID=47721 RepID=A0A9P3Q216_LYOSH|nr:hypothetical protein LshimejAT787_2500550 [Lyophyllum shimeji]
MHAHDIQLELPLICVGERAQRCALSTQLATYLFELGNTHAPGSAGLPFLRAVFDIGSIMIHPSWFVVLILCIFDCRPPSGGRLHSF